MPNHSYTVKVKRILVLSLTAHGLKWNDKGVIEETWSLVVASQVVWRKTVLLGNYGHLFYPHKCGGFIYIYQFHFYLLKKQF